MHTGYTPKSQSASGADSMNTNSNDVSETTPLKSTFKMERGVNGTTTIMSTTPGGNSSGQLQRLELETPYTEETQAKDSMTVSSNVPGASEKISIGIPSKLSAEGKNEGGDLPVVKDTKTTSGATNDNSSSLEASVAGGGGGKV